MDLIPQQIMEQQNPTKVASNEKVCLEIQKGIPRLKQLCIIDRNRLGEHLTKHGCVQCRFMPSLWKNKTLLIIVTLIVDDLGIKFIIRESAQHLIDTLRKKYEITTDWNVKNYLCLELE